MSLFVTIVLDGVGVGFLPDASNYGDVGSNTLEHVCEHSRPVLPNLAAAGLGKIHPLAGIAPTESPSADFGRMIEKSAGKDSTTGHWELAGLSLDQPFPTYPDGFPQDVIESFVEATGCPGVLGNISASGTQIIADLGDEHVTTGKPIVYTSADSVFQIAADKETIPLDTLYKWCKIARDKVCIGKHAVGRVIARPFIKSGDGYARVSSERKDFSFLPPREVLQSRLQQHDVNTVSVGKIADLFGGVGFDRVVKTKNNADGIARTLEEMDRPASGPTFIWVNLVDFDQEYGHRNNPDGFARSLEEFDAALPALLDKLPAGGRLIVTADHGNDPTFPGTDHTREYVPLLVFGGDGAGQDLGTRASFADHAATVCTYFGVPILGGGSPF